MSWVIDPQTGEEISYDVRPTDLPSIRVTVDVLSRSEVYESCETINDKGVSKPPPGRDWIKAGAQPEHAVTRWVRRRAI
jgi:hypothetical protein